jgi:hypothetical protein
MNVYQKNYTAEFIKSLPVDFNKIKNMDLSTIPTEYHNLFTTDWNWGNQSKMPMNQRIILHQLHLEYQHNDCIASIELKNPLEEKNIIGFVND